MRGLRTQDTYYHGYTVCIYCGQMEPNFGCPNCDWEEFRTGVGLGVYCPDCGYKIT